LWFYLGHGSKEDEKKRNTNSQIPEQMNVMQNKKLGEKGEGWAGKRGVRRQALRNYAANRNESTTSKSIPRQSHTHTHIAYTQRCALKQINEHYLCPSKRAT